MTVAIVCGILCGQNYVEGTVADGFLPSGKVPQVVATARKGEASGAMAGQVPPGRF